MLGRAMPVHLPESQPELASERLLYVPYSVDDAGWFTRLAGPLEVARWTGLPHPLDEPAARAWLAERAVVYLRGTGVAWAVRRRVDGQPIGGASLRLNAEFEVADLGFWVAADFWGQRYASEMAHRTLGFAFDQWEARRLEAHCVADNAGSARILERLGFVREGCLRQGFQRFGAVHDLWLYGMLRAERP